MRKLIGYWIHTVKSLDHRIGPPPAVGYVKVDLSNYIHSSGTFTNFISILPQDSINNTVK